MDRRRFNPFRFRNICLVRVCQLSYVRWGCDGFNIDQGTPEKIGALAAFDIFPR